MPNVRKLLPDFSLNNPLYATATVSVFTVDPTTLMPTQTLAPLYSDPVFATTIANPQILDGQGKWIQPVFVDQPVIMQIGNTTAANHTTGIEGQLGAFKSDWVSGLLYVTGDTIRDGLAGTNTSNVYYCAVPHVAGVFATDLAAARWIIYVSATAVAGGVIAAAVAASLTAVSAAGYLTANQSITLSGAATGSGATAIPVTLVPTGVGAGSYAKVTVNAAGQVVSGGTLLGADITAALGYTPVNASNGTAANLTLTGASTFTSGTFSTTLGVTGNTTVGGTLGVTGASTLTGLLTASGGISGIGGLAFSLSNNAGNSLLNFAANNFVQYIPGTSLTLSTPNAAVIGGNTVTLQGTANTSAGLTVAGNLICNGYVQAIGSTAQSGTSYYLGSGGVVTGAWSVGMGFYCGAQWMGAAGFATLSDRRAKEDIEDITAADAHEWLRKGRARRFTVNGKPSAGFIAQEDIEAGRGHAVTLIADEDPRFAAETPHAPAGHRLNRDYNHDVAYLTAALQDCLARIAVLESRLP